MTKAAVIKLLKENKNEQGIAHWKMSDPSSGKWTSFGIGLTQLKKLAKTVGKDHALAKLLWDEPNYDCRILSILIEEPKKIDEAQVETQIDKLNFWLMSHTYCQNITPKLSFTKEKTVEWIKSKDDGRRRCGYLTLYELAKDTKKYSDEFFAPYVDIIEKQLQREENFVKDAMNNCLMTIGMRSAQLNKRVVKAVKKIGKVEVDYGDNSCQAVDVLKHIESDRVKKKLGL